MYVCIVSPLKSLLKMHFRNGNILQNGVLRLLSGSEAGGERRQGSTKSTIEKSPLLKSAAADVMKLFLFLSSLQLLSATLPPCGHQTALHQRDLLLQDSNKSELCMHDVA